MLSDSSARRGNEAEVWLESRLGGTLLDLELVGFVCIHSGISMFFADRAAMGDKFGCLLQAACEASKDHESKDLVRLGYRCQCFTTFIVMPCV